MIYPTGELSQKIELLDKLLGALSLEDLKQITETELVVAKLKGTNENPRILARLIQEHDQMTLNMSAVQGDLWNLKEEIKTLVRLAAKPYEPYVVNEFNSLKSKHGIY